jgi:hypothetical protein
METGQENRSKKTGQRVTSKHSSLPPCVLGRQVNAVHREKQETRHYRNIPLSHYAFRLQATFSVRILKGVEIAVISEQTIWFN